MFVGTTIACFINSETMPLKQFCQTLYYFGEEPWSSGEGRQLMIKSSEFEPLHCILDGCKRC